MPISNIVECIKFAEKELQDTGLKAPMVGHVGDGNFHVSVVYDKALEMDGTITGEHGIGLQKRSIYLNSIQIIFL